MSAANVINLDDWRYQHVSRAQLAAAQRRDGGIPFGWHSLLLDNDPRTYVRVYARLGLHPIAIHGIAENGTCTCGRSDCAAIGKHPVHRGWQSAALDVEALDRALQSNWRMSVGLRMGRQPNGWNLVAIDVDGPLDLLRPIEAEHGQQFPPTLTAQSARGFHLIYRLPPDFPVRNRTRLAPHVDVRAEGGQIVCAPSRHVSGARYRWITAVEPVVLP